MTSPDLVSRPTRVRYVVLGFACVLSMITYLDRVCFGVVADNIKSEFGLDNFQKGLLFTAFALAYAMFEVPSGWLGDIFGPKRTLIRIVLWWSFFTALTGLIWPFSIDLKLFVFTSFGALLLVRFLFGVGEAGAYPNISRTFHNWFPFTERGFAQGAVWMAGRFGGGITPLVIGALLFKVQTPDGSWIDFWRHIFWILGVLGITWCIAFWIWFRDTPEQHPSVNEAERVFIRGASVQLPKVDFRPSPTADPGKQVSEGITEAQGTGQAITDEPPPPSSVPAAPAASGDSHSNVPWGKLLGNRNLWILCLMYFCAAYGWYFNITWLPGYLEKKYGVTTATHGYWVTNLLKGAPLLMGSMACLIGGLLTDWFIRRTGDRKWGRRLFGVIGHGVCALCYFACLAAGSEYTFVLWVALASFWNDLTMGSAWASCIDIGRKYSGIVSGCMNTVGNLGGAMAGLATGWILDMYDKDLNMGWRINFISFGAVYVLAVCLWLMFDATKPVVQEEH